MTRILFVNPNTTEAVTQTVLAEARRCAGPDIAVEGVTGRFGATIVSTEAENTIAAHATLDLLANHHAGFDAAVVAMSFDAGVFAARTVLPIPVVGITEAALHTACMVGRRFGLVVLGTVSLPLYADLVERIGLKGRLAAIEAVELASVAGYLDRAGVDEAIAAAVQRLEARGGVDVAVVCGAAVAGVAHRLRERVALPLLDGVAPALAQAEALARLRLRPPNRLPRLAAGAPPLALSPALARLIDGAS
ncbi:MAG TPA: aspartate/glutamate racemase family protein [Xanthobacteraceae bacterium]|nr:aspartate/glutamate racemase family protein [Xanthobacteraceae bacterium]